MRPGLRSSLFCLALGIVACSEEDSEELSDETPCRWRIESEDGKSLAKSSGLCEVIGGGPVEFTLGPKSGSTVVQGTPAAELVVAHFSLELHTEPWSFEVRGSDNPESHVFLVGAREVGRAELGQTWLCNRLDDPPVSLRAQFSDIEYGVSDRQRSRFRGSLDAVCRAQSDGSASLPPIRIHVAFAFKKGPLPQP